MVYDSKEKVGDLCPYRNTVKLAICNKFEEKFMQIYWTLNQIPELQGLTPEQTKQAWQFCYKKYALNIGKAC